MTTAGNGRDALDQLRQRDRAPAVVILDLVMPVLDGGCVFDAMQDDPALSRIRSSSRRPIRTARRPAQSSWPSRSSSTASSSWSAIWCDDPDAPIDFENAPDASVAIAYLHDQRHIRDMMKPSALALTLILATSSTALGDDNYLWGAAAATCTPGVSAIEASRYQVVAGSVKHADGESGLITLYCPIHAPMWVPAIFGGPTSPPGDLTVIAKSPNTLRLTYRDQDGSASSQNVEAQVIRMAKSDGSISSVAGAAVNSSSFGGTGSQTRRSAKFSHSFNFGDSYYYVRIDLNRASANGEAIAYGVALEFQD